MSKYCYSCQKFHWNNESCYPKYNVYYEDEDDPSLIGASDHEDAAVKFAENYNVNNDYSLINETIEIKVEKDGVIKKFEVHAEPSIHYSSKEIE